MIVPIHTQKPCATLGCSARAAPSDVFCGQCRADFEASLAVPDDEALRALRAIKSALDGTDPFTAPRPARRTS